MTRRRERSLWAKARGCSPGELLVLAEALVLIVLAAVAVRLLAFPTLGRLASLRLRVPPPGPERRRELAEMVAWAVCVTAKRSPLRALCFERALTAQVMLRRRNVDSTLFYGLRQRRRDDGTIALDGHVWVIDDGIDVAGADVAGEYRVMTSFPEGRIEAGYRLAS